MERTVSVEIGGRTLSLQSGKIARQAGGSAVMQYGGTVVLVAATADKKPVQKDFVPLTVDYRERTYAAGRIPGGFFKREGRPTEKETLTSRLIDRPIRPLFPKSFPFEMQVLCTVLSSDQENDSDVLAMNCASAALILSDIPFPGAIGCVRVGRVEGEFVVNPTFAQLEASTMDVVVAGTKDNILMVEGGTREVGEAEFLEALRFAHAHIQVCVKLQEDLARTNAKEKRPLVEGEDLSELTRSVQDHVLAGVKSAIRIAKKEDRQNELVRLEEECAEALAERFPESEGKIAKIFHDIERQEMREMVLSEGVRADGRSPDQIRPIRCEVSVLPRTHGSALFTRGETQALAVSTLGTSSDEQRVEELEGQSWKSYMLHYNFPPYSVGEVRPMRGPGRREIGHGALAERAIEPVIPADSVFPYTLRIVSDILESNGSSSMATVCAGSLSLMDAGVPIKAPVAGIAMGLMKEGDRVAVLSDILGAEDHLGDMDFKVTGTRHGITAFQMDIKIGGITFEILDQALARARDGRMHILNVMDQCLSEPREEISAYAPRISIMQINPDKIREVIGPGGKIIKRITEETGAQIDIEDTGEVRIAAYTAEGGKRAEEIIRGIVEDPEVGSIYKGRVRSIVSFGAFVEIVPGKDGLLHISEIDHKRTARVEDVLQVDDIVEVKVIGVDREGKIKLSRKALLPEPERETSGRR
ncbi:MAG: polyribonucleotide nucleotidyltransferase [Candidatus Eiseniibacteriota bacterium]